MNLGDGTGIPCPQNCGGTILYNGNYFCSNYTPGHLDGPCHWALSHGDNGEPVTEQDKRVWRVIRRSTWFTGLASQPPAGTT